MLNNQQIYPTESLGIDPSQSVAGDYAFYNREKVCIIPNDTDLTTLPENYIPIGVVVVPGTHNVYGDGSCGVMSLKPMSCDAPSTGGTSEQNMSWGVYGTNISVLPNLDQVPTGNTSMVFQQVKLIMLIYPVIELAIHNVLMIRMRITISRLIFHRHI